MELYTCKNCGEDIEVASGQKTAVCEFCGMEQTLPILDDPRKIELLLDANDRRMRCRFDIAKKLYEQVIAQYPDDNEAYWCKLLCEYGIEYVEDSLTEKNIPTCHRTVTESVFDNRDYKFIMSRATAEEKAIYEAEAIEIDRIQKDIIAKASKSESYDIFICYKEADIESRKRTLDSQYANKIYTHLINNGYKVFFSRVTLNQMMGSEYEPVIYSALKSAKVMLHVTTSVEHTNSPWVRNEWSRYLEFMREDTDKVIMPCIARMDAYQLPEELAQFQVAEITDLDFVENLLRQLNSKFGKVYTYGMAQPTPTPTPQPTPQAISANPQVVNMINRAKLFIEDGDWDNANKYAENSLDLDFECAEAYVVKLMCDFKIDVLHKLVKNGEFLTNRNYVKALRFASGELKSKLANMEIEYWTDKADEVSDADLLNDEFYKTITEKLKSFGSYRGADKLLAELPKKRELAKKYDTALTLINNDLRNEEIYQKAEECLKSLGGYKDAEELLESLPQKREDMCFSMELSKDGKYYILKYALDKNVKSCVVPSIYKGLPIKEIGRYSFNECNSLASIEIPDSVTSIGDRAFSGCDGLTSIEIPNSITSIGDYAFYDCSSLTSIEIPDSLTSIGEGAFKSCDSLTSIKIPYSVTNIKEYAFTECDTLTIYCETEIEMEDWSEDWNSFDRPIVWDCKNNNIADDGYIYGITVDGINYAIKDGEAKVVGTKAGGDIVIPGSIIYDSTFYTVTTIANGAFCFCFSLTSIKIPDSVTNIEECAFSECKNLIIYCEVANKPSGWSSDWNYFNRPVVWDCKNNNIADDGYIYGITVDGINYAIKDGEVEVVGTKASGDKVIQSSIIYNSTTYAVTSIGEEAFCECYNLTSIEIPDSVISIGKNAFSSCYNLTSIEIPDSVTSIGENAFDSCSSLTSIEIPDSVTSIGEYSFDDCNVLTIYCEVAIKLSGWDIDWNYSCRPVVWDCKNNNVADDGYIYGITVDGINYAIKDNSAKVVGTNASGNIVIPSTITYNSTTYTVTSIGEEAFRECYNLTSIEIPDSVTSIGDSAFSSCRNLTSIEIPDSVTIIEARVFSSCTSLTSIEIPDSVESIGIEAFEYCNSLTSIEIPDSVRVLEQSAFSSCDGLISIEIPDSVISIESYAFSYCTSLTSIKIPDSVESIESYVFDSCDNLTIYCEAESEMEDWSSDWNYSNCPVVWGYKG